MDPGLRRDDKLVLNGFSTKNVFPLWIPVHHGGFKERTFAGMTNLY